MLAFVISSALSLLQPLPSASCAQFAPTRTAASPTMLALRKKVQVASNRVARRNYEILEDYEAGIELLGTEVKSCRQGKCTLRDGYCRFKDGEVWLHNVNIGRHMTAGSYFQHEETRK